MAKQVRSTTLTVTLTPADRQRVQDAAKAEGRTASAFIHRTLMAALEGSEKKTKKASAK